MQIRVLDLFSCYYVALTLPWPFSCLTISEFRLKSKRQKGPVPGGHASVCPLQRDQTVVEGLRLRDPGSPFSLTLRAESRSVFTRVKREPCYSSLGSSPVSYSFKHQHLEWCLKVKGQFGLWSTDVICFLWLTPLSEHMHLH